MSELQADNPRPSEYALGGGVFAVLMVLALGAMGLCGYLLWGSRGAGVAGCGEGSGCGTVLTSPWSKWLGIPVALLAMLVYADIVAGLLLLRRADFAPFPGAQRLVRFWLVMLAAALLAAAGWFTWVQAGVLHAFCPWCLATHSTGAVLALLLIGTLAPGPRSGLGAGAAGVALVAVLAVGQVLRPAPTYRIVDFAGIHIEAGRYPIVGDPHAPYLLVELFDYTCPNCRVLHHYLKEAQARFPGEFATALGTVPLEPPCNPIIADTDPIHAHGCEYARLALAVWRAAPGKFAAYDDWLNTGEAPPPVAAAQARAAELVAPRTVAEVLSDGWADAFIRQNVQLNELLRQRARQRGVLVGDGVPTLVLPDGTLMAGRPATAKEFLDSLGRALKRARAMASTRKAK